MKSTVKLSFVALSCFLSSNTFASGLDDLKAALEGLKGNTPIRAQLFQQVTETRGEDDDLEIKNGEVQVLLHDDSEGLKVIYSNAVLTTLEQETMQKVEDESTPTPTLMAVNSIETTELRAMLSATVNIQRRLSQAIFIDEKPVERDGKQLRLLEFTMPLESIIDDKRTRGYVKKFESSYRVLIDEAGIPVETKLSFHGKGRAYVVLRVEAMGAGMSQYEVIGDRLVCVRSEYQNGWDSTFGEGEFTEVQELNILSANNTANQMTVSAQAN